MPPLGFIRKQDRTPAQHVTAALAESRMAQFHGLPVPTVPQGAKIILADAWKDPAVVKDLGFAFPRFHQLTGSCFPGGTPVRKADGSETAIEAIQVGDEVITHTGQARRVVNTMTRLFTGEMVSITLSGFPFPLEMTADHPVAVTNEAGSIRWVRADELQEGDRALLGWDRREPAAPTLDLAELLGRDRVVILDELMKDDAYTKGQEPDVPVSNVCMARYIVRRSGIDWKGRIKLVRSRTENAVFRHVPVCPSLGRLFGLYLAEGGCDAGRVVFTFDAKEEDLAAEVLALVRGLFGVEGYMERQANRQSVLKVRFDNHILAEVFKELVPGNVYGKRVPGIFFASDEGTRLALLLGWMAGDGYVGVKKDKSANVRITGVTVCPGLARDMTTLALSCGVRATTGRRKARKQSKESFGVDLTGKKAVSLFPAVAARALSPQYAVADKSRTRFGYARGIRKIERRQVESFRVFDFEVEEEHSFIAGGITVHNCVGAGGGNALATLICVQRKLATSPTKAVLPFWPFDYGRCRWNEGDRGQGEGAMGSSFADTVVKEGVLDANEAGLPAFQNNDGLVLTSQLEMQWSDGGSSLVTKWQQTAKQYPLGAATPCKSSQDIKALILNGYPGSFACDNYIGNASVQGSGADAAVCGYWNGSGGHQQYFIGYWENPTLGPLYGIGNNWPGSTYPQDPGGLPICTCWVTEAHVDAAFRLDAEVYGFSHLTWFPAQPDVLSWLV